MGVKHGSESPSKAHALSMSSMDLKKYIVVRNHVREIEELPQRNNSIKTEEQSMINEDCSKENRKRKQPSKYSILEDHVSVTEEVNDISESDLEELRAVYKKCKSVLMKIESKYGHLLNLDCDECSPKKISCTDIENICRCSFNKKIVFNEEGHSTQLTENSLKNHICLNRLKNYKHNCVQIDDERVHIPLPDNIQELEEMLTNTSIPITLRNRIIAKIKLLKEENSNMIRFDKHLLIQKLKSDPDEILAFKGTNISSLTGYPI